MVDEMNYFYIMFLGEKLFFRGLRFWKLLILLLSLVVIIIVVVFVWYVFVYIIVEKVGDK